MIVSKAAASQAIPHALAAGPPANVTAPPPSPPATQKALTVKLDPDLYWRLQRYCIERGQAEGRRVTHQDVMTEGLRRVLDDQS